MSFILNHELCFQIEDGSVKKKMVEERERERERPDVGICAGQC